MNLITGAVRTYDSSATSNNSLGLTWGCNQEVFYQKPGNRNIMRLDIETGTLRELLDDESNGWIFLSMVHPNERQVAVWWNRHLSAEDGIWLLPLTNESNAQLLLPSVDSNLFPLRWSPDGVFLYYCQYSLEISRLCRVNTNDKQVDTLLVIPLGLNGKFETYPALSPNLRTLIYSEVNITSDAWLMQDFDPDIK